MPGTRRGGSFEKQKWMEIAQEKQRPVGTCLRDAEAMTCSSWAVHQQMSKWWLRYAAAITCENPRTPDEWTKCIIEWVNCSTDAPIRFIYRPYSECRWSPKHEPMHQRVLDAVSIIARVKKWIGESIELVNQEKQWRKEWMMSRWVDDPVMDE